MKSIDCMAAANSTKAHITGLAELTRARTSGLADLMNVQGKQDEVIAKWILLTFETEDQRKDKLYKAMAVKAQNCYNILVAEIKKLTKLTSISASTFISLN